MATNASKGVTNGEKIAGVLERVTYRDVVSGFLIAKLRPTRGDLITLVGTLPELHAGQFVQCWGNWRQHPVHGREFQVDHCESHLPRDDEAMRRYLASGVIRGVGVKWAERIVERFGANTLAVLNQTPERLLEIPKFGKKRLAQLSASWGEQSKIREVMLFLQRYGIGSAIAKKIYRAWRRDAIAKLQADPFALAREIFGIGFKTADEIAVQLGIAAEDPKRLDAGVECILSELTGEGHTCYPLDPYLQRVAAILKVAETSLRPRLHALCETGRIVIAPHPISGNCEPFIWTAGLLAGERGIAHQLARLTRASSSLRRFDRERAIAWAQRQLGLQLAPHQMQAVKGAFSGQAHVITGGPGTGKSTITKIIVRLARELGARVLLAAPTGRAAKRLAQVNAARASTLHQLLEYDFGKNAFKRDRDHPLEVDLLIVDEASMVDTWLFHSTLKALPSGAKLLLIGDVDQLPSVGPGNVLRDIIDSKVLGVTKLDKIFRQAEHSQIVQVAHGINRGIAPKRGWGGEGDLFILAHEDPARIAETIVGLVCKRLPAKRGLDPYRDIQVLAAMKRGVIGLANLNLLLQRHLHPREEGMLIGARRFFVGDKVMQLRNNYRKEVFNGDIGKIVQIRPNDGVVIVELLDDREIEYDFTELDELQHAYAVSVHKFQGSESPCIILPIHLSHSILLHRNLLYTAVTRGKSLVILVGSPRALELAVRKREGSQRYTGLKEELINARISNRLAI